MLQANLTFDCGPSALLVFYMRFKFFPPAADVEIDPEQLYSEVLGLFEHHPMTTMPAPMLDAVHDTANRWSRLEHLSDSEKELFSKMSILGSLVAVCALKKCALKKVLT